MGKRESREERRGRARARWLTGIAALLYAILAGRLFTLQHIRYGYYSQYAAENRVQRERLVSPRGLIRDRNGRVLVDNVPRYSVLLPWRREDEARDTIERLNRYLPLDTTSIYARFDVWKRKNSGIPFPVINNADKLVLSFVRENYDLFPKLRVQTQARRRYRYGEFAAHLLGYVGEVSDEFLSQSGGHRDYYPGDAVGRTGIESVCERFLRGKDGQRVVAVNASGTMLGELTEALIPPVPGRTVHLTIDAALQKRLEELISPRGAGAAVVMDVEDGSIIAAVSLPQFDPNSFAMGIRQDEWDALNNADEKPLFNRFMRATYPPGSTLKIISMYTVLVNNLVPPRKLLVYCTGAHRFGNRTFRCWKWAGHGYMNLHQGFVQSCDTYFYKIGEDTDVDVLASAARDFGFGARTGVDLPGEAVGLVPDRAYYNRRFGKGKWTQGVVLNNVIGQGEYLVTVMQLCRATAAVANGGYLVRPHVVKEIEGEGKRGFSRRKVRKLTGATLRAIQRAMIDVVQDEHGTARASRIKGITAAGKTGTAQNSHGEDHAWFTGFAPADNPEIAIAIVVENAGHGGSVAAPIAGAFYAEYFELRDAASAPGSRSSDRVTRQGAGR